MYFLFWENTSLTIACFKNAYTKIINVNIDYFYEFVEIIVSRAVYDGKKKKKKGDQ